MRRIDSVFRNIAIAAAMAAGLSAPLHAGVIYASNFNSDTITAYDAATGAFLGTPVTGGAEAFGFNGVVLFNHSFIVTAQLSNNVIQYGGNGALLNIFDPTNTAGLDSPQDLTRGPDGKLYVVSSANDKILRYDPATGNFIDTFSDLSSLGHVGPIGLAFGPDGNLYVTGFDQDLIVQIDGTTGAILGSFRGPAGFGFGPAAFGPGGALYVDAIDLSTFAGALYRYNITTSALDLFIPQGSGGFQSPGGLVFYPGGNLFVSNLIFDQNFTDTGSTILSFDPVTGAPLGTLVGPGNGLNIPFFLTADVPEPSTIGLLGLGSALFMLRARARRR